MKKLILIILFSLLFVNLYSDGMEYETIIKHYYPIKKIKYEVRKLGFYFLLPELIDDKDYSEVLVCSIEEAPDLLFRIYAKCFYIGKNKKASYIIMNKTKQKFDVYKYHKKQILATQAQLSDYGECYIVDYKETKYLIFWVNLGIGKFGQFFVFDITDKNNIAFYTLVCGSFLGYTLNKPLFGEYNGQLCFFAGIYDYENVCSYAAPFIIKNSKMQEMLGKDGKKFRVYFDWDRYGDRMYRYTHKTF